VFSFKKKQSSSKENNLEDPKDLKEQLFFHDLINQTHGLLLFLNSKMMSGKDIDQSEVMMMEKEIKTLQSLIRDHYNFKHKNLVQTYDWVPFSYAKLAFGHLCQTYLLNVEVKTVFEITASDDDLIHYPSFYRIMNNLIKNISESHCTHVDFLFMCSYAGLKIETKNVMNVRKGDHSSEYLAQVILNEKVTPIKSLGLDSIHHMAEDNGGHFSFEIKDNHWINKIFLPVKNPRSQKISDKIPA